MFSATIVVVPDDDGVKELRVLAEHLPFDVWVRDHHDRCIYANAVCQQHWPGLVGRTPAETDIPPSVVATWVANNERARRGEVVVGDVEYGEGDRRWVVRNIIAPVRRDGEIVGTVGVNIEITSQREAERAAREREAIVTAMFDAAHALMGVREIVGDDDLLHLADNRASQAVFGLEADSAGMLDSQLGVPVELREKAIRTARLSSERAQPIDFEITYPVPGRGVRTFKGKVASINHELDQRERFLYFAEDVTDVRMLEAQVMRAERLASLGTLAASVAHEIKNPAAAMLLTLEMLRRKLEPLLAHATPVERSGLLALIDNLEQGTSHISTIVRDLSRLAQPNDDRVEAVRLDEVVRCAVGLAHGVVSQSAKVELDLGAPPAVRGSSIRLAQVVINLVVNAGQALARAGRRGTIVVRTGTADGRARLEVLDDGPGVSDELRAKMFAPFVSGSEEGTGLGLYVCRQIVEAHGGTITALARDGGGTLMRVDFPG
jgi:signal transduction histidine kinase